MFFTTFRIRLGMVEFSGAKFIISLNWVNG